MSVNAAIAKTVNANARFRVSGETLADRWEANLDTRTAVIAMIIGAAQSTSAQ